MPKWSSVTYTGDDDVRTVDYGGDYIKVYMRDGRVLKFKKRDMKLVDEFYVEGSMGYALLYLDNEDPDKAEYGWFGWGVPGDIEGAMEHNYSVWFSWEYSSMKKFLDDWCSRKCEGQI